MDGAAGVCRRIADKGAVADRATLIVQHSLVIDVNCTSSLLCGKHGVVRKNAIPGSAGLHIIKRKCTSMLLSASVGGEKTIVRLDVYGSAATAAIGAFGIIIGDNAVFQNQVAPVRSVAAEHCASVALCIPSRKRQIGNYRRLACMRVPDIKNTVLVNLAAAFYDCLAPIAAQTGDKPVSHLRLKGQMIFTVSYANPGKIINPWLEKNFHALSMAKRQLRERICERDNVTDTVGRGNPVFDS